MRLPLIKSGSGGGKQLIAFGGINKSDSYSEGELRDCENLSSENYPSITPSKGDTLIWSEKGLQSIYPAENGYMVQIGNKLSFVRKVTNEEAKLCFAGQKRCFTFVSASVSSSTAVISISEKNKKEDIQKIKGEYITFGDENVMFEVKSATATSDGTASITIAKTDKSGEITFSEDLLDEDKGIYRLCSEEEYLITPTKLDEGTRTVAVSQPLTTEEIERLRGKKLTLAAISGGEVYKEYEIEIAEGSNSSGITYLTLSKEVSTGNDGGEIYLRAVRPQSSELTERESLAGDPANLLKSENAKIYRDTFSENISTSQKEFAVGNGYIVVFPDKVCYNTENFSFEKMEKKIICPRLTAEFGTDFFECTEADFLTSGLKAGDAVTFSAIGTENSQDIPQELAANLITVIIRGIEKNKLSFNSNTFAVYDSQKYDIVLRRIVPALSNVGARGARLYGTEKNRIHISKYGDVKNFQFFQGGSSDSYYIDIASNGEFTGGIACSSYYVFFKENEIIKVYGDMPSEYQIVSTLAKGVMKGSGKSVAVIGGTIYYLGSDGVYAYSGGYPAKISGKLAGEKMSCGVGTAIGNLYVLTVKTEKGNKTYTYDTEKGIWLSEKREKTNGYFGFENDDYYISTEKLYKIKSGEKGDFFAEFCPMNENTFLKKKYQRFFLRCNVAPSASLTVEVRFDESPWRTVKRITQSKGRTVNIPIFPNRSDSVTLRLTGHGDVKVISLLRQVSGGSYNL